MPPRKTTKTNTRKNYNTTSKRSGISSTTRSSQTNYSTYACNSPKFKTVKGECQWRMGSYRNVYTQFSGTQKTCISPTVANRWIKYVNNGNRVYKFANAVAELLCHPHDRQELPQEEVRRGHQGRDPW